LRVAAFLHSQDPDRKWNVHRSALSYALGQHH